MATFSKPESSKMLARPTVSTILVISTINDYFRNLWIKRQKLKVGMATFSKSESWKMLAA